jgi:hypothetical protein
MHELFLLLFPCKRRLLKRAPTASPPDTAVEPQLDGVDLPRKVSPAPVKITKTHKVLTRCLFNRTLASRMLQLFAKLAGTIRKFIRSLQGAAS